MGFVGGSKKNTTNNTVNTTTTNTTRDIGLTGEAAVALAREVQGTAREALASNVALSQIDANRAQIAQEEETARLAHIVDYGVASRALATEEFRLSTTSNNANYSQLLGGANNLVSTGERLIGNVLSIGVGQNKAVLDASERTGNRIIDTSMDYSGDIIDATENTRNKLLDVTTTNLNTQVDKAIAFADRNISSITKSAVDGASFVTSTAKDIAKSIIPQTAELKNIALALIVVTGIVAVVATRRGNK